MDLSVVILNWNTAALLEQSLDTLVGTQSAMEYEIVVVDNNSTDNSREMVAAEVSVRAVDRESDEFGLWRGQQCRRSADFGAVDSLSELGYNGFA